MRGISCAFLPTPEKTIFFGSPPAAKHVLIRQEKQYQNPIVFLQKFKILNWNLL